MARKQKRRSSSKTVRRVQRTVKRTVQRTVKEKPKPALRALPPPAEVRLIVGFLESKSVFHHRESSRRLTPQGVPTVESRVNAAKSAILREIAESIQAKEHLMTELWEEIDDD